MPVMRLIILLVAAAAAIGAAFLVRGLQNAPVPVEPIKVATQAKKKEVPALKVLVAKADLRIGQYIAPDHLAWQDWPEKSNTLAFYTDQNNPDIIDELVGGVVRSEMLAGEPFTGQKIVHPGKGGFMSAIVTPGMRAVAIEIESETAAGGFIFPNDRVDVILIHDVEVMNGEYIEEELAIDTILNNVRVLAIDGYYRTVAGEEGNAIVGNRATLELTKEDAMVLMAADKKGSLSLTLRSIAETDGPSGSTPRSRQLAARRSGGVEGIRVFEFGNDSLVSTQSGSIASGEPIDDDDDEA